MEVPDKNPFPKIDLFPRLTRVSKAIGGLFNMHQLSPVSEHFQDHPLDQVFDEPPYQPVLPGLEDGKQL